MVTERELYPGWVSDDPNWRAVLWLFSQEPLKRKGCLRYVDASAPNPSIQWRVLEHDLKPSTWSRSENAIYRLAWTLWRAPGSDREAVPLADLIELDDEHFSLAIQAMGVYRYGKVCVSKLHGILPPDENLHPTW